MREIYGRIEDMHHYRPEEAKSDMMRGSYVYITHDLYAYGYLSGKQTPVMEICSLTEVYLPVKRIKVSRYVLKASPYKRIMNYQ